jgi:DNA-binding MarR family transcriptional regulator
MSEPAMADSADNEAFLLARSTSHLLHRAQQLAAERFAVLVGEDGLTQRQFEVLAAIGEAPGLSQSDLVRATSIDRSTLADMANRMEKRGWITRAISAADARANAVRLAPAGAALLAAALNHAKAADAAVLDALPKAKRKAFQETLLRLSRVAAEAAEAAEKAARKADKKRSKLEAKARGKLEKTKKKKGDAARKARG